MRDYGAELARTIGIALPDLNQADQVKIAEMVLTDLIKGIREGWSPALVRGNPDRSIDVTYLVVEPPRTKGAIAPVRVRIQKM